MTERAKLDLIWERCKKNMSTTDDLEAEWVEICKKVAESNPNTSCPLFRTYLYHLEEIDKFIYLDQSSGKPIYRATATGLMFEGYVQRASNEKEISEANEARKIRTEKNEKRLADWTQNLTYGTWAAATGGILLFLVELVKLFLEHRSCR